MYQETYNNQETYPSIYDYEVGDILENPQYDGTNINPSSSQETTHIKSKAVINEDCRICWQKAHGLHFGIYTCRACAAFFRRTIVRNCKYTCRLGTNNCEMTPDEKYQCKLCRFNKCLKLGMTSDNVQWNRDTISSGDTKKAQKRTKSASRKNEAKPAQDPDAYLPNSLSSENPSSADSLTSGSLGSPPNIPPPILKPTVQVPGSEKVEAYCAIKARLESIFRRASIYDDFPSTSWLQRMEHALSKRRTVVSRNPPYLETIKFEHYKPLMNEQMILLCEYMMQCQQFARLPLEEKLILFKSTWADVYWLERYQMSVELFGQRCLTESMVIASDGFCTRRDKFRMDVSSITDYDSDYINSIMSPFRNVDNIIGPLLDLQPTHTEINYLMMQALWNVEDTMVNKDTLEMADQVRERFSDELHSYYTTEMGISNYANRLHRLMAIVHAVRSSNQDRERMIELARLFDVFKVKDECF